MSSITFGPARPCNECRENFMKFLSAVCIGMDIALIMDVVEEAAKGRLSRRQAIIMILLAVVCIAALAYSKGRLHGIRTLADRLNDARRREHEETEEETEMDEAEAAITEEGEITHE